MSTRTILIALEKPRALTLVFKRYFTTGDGKLFLQDSYEATTETDGTGTIALPVKSAGTTLYTVESREFGLFPKQQFYLSAGDAATLAALIAAGGEPSETVLDYIDERLAAFSGGETAILSLAGHYPNARFPAAYILAAPEGTSDLYTVPAGKKAIVSDFMVTNPTGGSIAYYPLIKIGATYYRIGGAATEAAGGIGHNYSMAAARSQPILLNEGETFAVSAGGAGLSVWAAVVEFDDSAPYERADIRDWTAGNNILLTIPEGKTVNFGAPAFTTTNQPSLTMTAIVYHNGSGASRTMSGFYLVPPGGAPSAENQFAGSNFLVDTQSFGKYFYGNLNAGDSIVIVSDSNAAGQFAWVIYTIV